MGRDKGKERRALRIRMSRDWKLEEKKKKTEENNTKPIRILQNKGYQKGNEMRMEVEMEDEECQ